MRRRIAVPLFPRWISRDGRASLPPVPRMSISVPSVRISAPSALKRPGEDRGVLGDEDLREERFPLREGGDHHRPLRVALRSGDPDRRIVQSRCPRRRVM